MSTTAAHREQLKAFATGDIDRAQELNNSLSEQERKSYHQLLGALFAVLLDNHFQEDASPQAISEFVDKVRRDYEAANAPFNAWTVEGVLRAASGEEHLFEQFSSEDILTTQTIVVGRLAIYDPSVSGNIDAFLDDAEELLAEWQRDDQ